MDRSFDEICNQMDQLFATFDEKLNAIRSPSTSSTDTMQPPTLLMPLPTNYEGADMNEFMENWMNDQQDVMSQTIVDLNTSVASNSVDQLLSVVYHNTSGMRSKIHDFNDSLAWTKFDLFLFAETWFDSTIEDINITAGTDFKLYRRDRAAYGGGVAAAIRNYIEVIQSIKWPEFEHIEALTLCLKNECITIYYWPPRSDRQIRAASSNELLILLERLKELRRHKDIYDKSKARYIQHDIKESNGNRMEWYKFFKFKSKDRVSLPPKKSYNGDLVKSEVIAKYMATHLSSAFAEGDIRLYDGDIESNLHSIWSQHTIDGSPKKNFHQSKCLI